MILRNGSYFRAAGTRNAFGALSDALEAEGRPPLTVIDGDREEGEQEAGFRLRYRPATSASDVGPYGDRRFWPGHGYWVRISPGGTMAVPGSSNHEKRRSADLAEPYASPGPNHARAIVLARRFGIENEGATWSANNREWWHWTFYGVLGAIGSPAGGGSTPFPTPTPPANPGNPSTPTKEEKDMFGFWLGRLADDKTVWIMNPWERTKRAIGPNELSAIQTAALATTGKALAVASYTEASEINAYSNVTL